MRAIYKGIEFDVESEEDLQLLLGEDEPKVVQKKERQKVVCVVCGTSRDCYPDNVVRGLQFCDEHYKTATKRKAVRKKGGWSWHPVDEAETAFVKENYKKMTLRQMAVKLGRSPSTISKVIADNSLQRREFKRINIVMPKEEKRGTFLVYSNPMLDLNQNQMIADLVSACVDNSSVLSLGDLEKLLGVTENQAKAVLIDIFNSQVAIFNLRGVKGKIIWNNDSLSFVR